MRLAPGRSVRARSALEERTQGSENYLKSREIAELVLDPDVRTASEFMPSHSVRAFS
jgi:hypothetical protein